MDGLLIDSEDRLTLSMNQLLEKYGRPPLTRSIRAQLMGVPNSSNGDLFHNWAKLPICRKEFASESKENMMRHFLDCEPLPGAEKLLSNLDQARNISGEKIEIALASSTHTDAYKSKTSRPETKRLLNFIEPSKRVLGDDPRVPPGRGKPAPDIYLLALQSLNSAMALDKNPIMPNECLVFEDSVAEVEAGRRAGMRVIWVPHPNLAAEYEIAQKDVLAGRTKMNEITDGSRVGEIDDGWAESIPSLEQFNYEKYGIALLS